MRAARAAGAAAISLSADPDINQRGSPPAVPGAPVRSAGVACVLDAGARAPPQAVMPVDRASTASADAVKEVMRCAGLMEGTAQYSYLPMQGGEVWALRTVLSSSRLGGASGSTQRMILFRTATAGSANCWYLLLWLYWGWKAESQEGSPCLLPYPAQVRWWHQTGRWPSPWWCLEGQTGGELYRLQPLSRCALRVGPGRRNPAEADPLIPECPMWSPWHSWR